MFDFGSFDSGSFIKSLKDFGELFLLCVPEFLILEELVELLDEKFSDLLWVFIFPEKVKEKVNVKFAFSFVCKCFEHAKQCAMRLSFVKSR